MIMHPAIEQIVSCVEAARTTVEQARHDGDLLMDEARQKTEKMLAALKEDIRRTDQLEIAPIVAEGQEQAQLIRERSEQYIEKLRKKLTVKKTKIVADFIDNALNPGDW